MIKEVKKMLFNSLHFLIFLPIVVAIYYILPRKVRYIWLLVSSYYFYMCWNAKYALLILFSTFITWISGILIENIKKKDWDEHKIKKYKKLCVVGSFTINLAILFFFKYFNFAFDNLNALLSNFNIQLNDPKFDILLPVGISFYTFQALGYTVDVYRDDIYAERNFFRYALFVSFFPQLVAGPIERSKNLLHQLAKPAKVNWEMMRKGAALMMWGYFLKVVLADRITIYVDTVYGNYQEYPGAYLVVATVLFAIQIYCDFAGYSIIAMGVAKMFGIELMENFNAPYTSQSVAEFWRRWHISLSTWFRDYLYIPLGGNRKGIYRKYLNLLITFAVSGLWHGANWTFVIWGLLNGLYQVIGNIIKPLRMKIISLFNLNTENFSHKLFRMFTTFVLVDFAWIFFRAQTIKEAFDIIKSMFTVYNPWVLVDGSLYNCGLERKNFTLMIICIGILLFADALKYRKIKVLDIIEKQDFWFRWMLYIFAILGILTFGIWGSNYDVAGFIYFQF